MRIERRHAGRRIRKMRRLSKRLKPGYLYFAPLGATPEAAGQGAWPADWLPLGATSEGISWTLYGEPVAVGETLDPLVFTTSREVSMTFDFSERAPRD